MERTTGGADLHLHTTASDGTCSLDARIEQAGERGLDAIAITDHDCISSDMTGRMSRNHGVTVITGVEVRAAVAGTKVELLGYYLDPTNSALRELLKRVRSHRQERNRRLIEELHSVTSFDRDYEDLSAGADGLLGRPHIANAPVETGVVDSVGEAFEEYLGGEGQAFVPMELEPAEDVIETLQAAGAVVSLAHPGRIRTEDPVSIVESLSTDGLDAIEVAYPYDETSSEAYADVGVEEATTLAEQFALLRTGGSDCHGPGSGKFRIGDVKVDERELDRLRRAADRRRPL